MPMCFNVQRRVDERVSRTEAPRRKPAPVGVVTAVQRTALGPLDSVLDTSLNATRHAAIVRHPSNRNLMESQPVVARAQKHRFDEAPRRVATYSHLRTTTFAVNDQEPPTPAPARGRRQVAAPTVSNSPRLAKPGRRVFPAKPASAPDAFKKGTHEGSAPDRSTPNLLKFSPRAGTAAHREALLAQRLARKQSTGMHKALTWSTTPRPAPRPRTVPTVAARAPYDASQQQPSLTSTTTSSFRRPPTAAAGSTASSTFANSNIAAGSEPARRVRGTQRVATRPKTARGLLTWNTD